MVMAFQQWNEHYNYLPEWVSVSTTLDPFVVIRSVNFRFVCTSVHFFFTSKYGVLRSTSYVVLRSSTEVLGTSSTFSNNSPFSSPWWYSVKYFLYFCNRSERGGGEENFIFLLPKYIGRLLLRSVGVSIKPKTMTRTTFQVKRKQEQDYSVHNNGEIWVEFSDFQCLSTGILVGERNTEHHFLEYMVRSDGVSQSTT